MNFQEQLENEKNPSIKKIGQYLLDRANDDSTIKSNILKENKNLKECYIFIRGKAKELAVNGCACIDDETVYGWAIHYYDEDEIKINKVESTKSKQIESNPIVKKEKVRSTKDKTPEGQLNLFSFED